MRWCGRVNIVTIIKIIWRKLVPLSYVMTIISVFTLSHHLYMNITADVLNFNWKNIMEFP
jgi:hypothetical protein